MASGWQDSRYREIEEREIQCLQRQMVGSMIILWRHISHMGIARDGSKLVLECTAGVGVSSSPSIVVVRWDSWVSHLTCCSRDSQVRMPEMAILFARITRTEQRMIDLITHLQPIEEPCSNCLAHHNPHDNVYRGSHAAACAYSSAIEE